MNKVGSQLRYTNPSFAVYADTYNRDGKEVIRDRITRADAVAMMAIENGFVYLVKQFRFGIEKYFLELPAGKIDFGETPEEAANRELQEEIGFKAETLKPLGGFYVSPAYCSEYIHLFVCENLVVSSLKGDEFGLEIVKATLNDVSRWINDGTITDAKTIILALKVLG